MVPLAKFEMPYYPIIGVFGQMGTGKTTLANMIREELANLPIHTDSYKFIGMKVTGFAEKLKNSIGDIFSMSRDDIERYKNESTLPNEWKVNMRTALQMYGQMCRNIYDKVWIETCLIQAMVYPIVIADARYLNEFDSIKNANGYTIVINRGESNSSTHPSELGVGEILAQRTPDMRVSNDATLAHLANLVRTMVIPKIIEFFNNREIPKPRVKVPFLFSDTPPQDEFTQAAAKQIQDKLHRTGSVSIGLDENGNPVIT